MSYILRPYQEEAVDAAYKHITDKKTKNKPAVIVAPTGSGKSLIIANLAMRLKGNILVFQPSKELLEQNFEKYISYGNEASIFSASKGQKEISKVTYATIGSAVNRVDEFKEFDYCIIDECHTVPTKAKSMYKRFFKENKMPIIGLTATPVRMNANMTGVQVKMINRQQGNMFRDICYVIQIKTILEQGFLSPLKYYKYDFDRSDLKPNSSKSDFTAQSIKESLTRQQVYKALSDVIKLRREEGRKNILVFCNTVAECGLLMDMVEKSHSVHSYMKYKERDELINRFKHGDIDCMFNVGVLTTGFDHPQIDCIIQIRPTMSFGLYYQMLGRGMRVHPDKQECVVDDLVGNFNKFGKVEDLIIEDLDDLGWHIHSNGKVLTNQYLHIPYPTIEELKLHKNKKTNKNGVYVFRFGKWKGYPITVVPKDYLDWCLKNLNENSYDNDIMFKQARKLHPSL